MLSLNIPDEPFLLSIGMQTFAHSICTFAQYLYTSVMKFDVTLGHKTIRFILLRDASSCNRISSHLIYRKVVVSN